MRYVLAFIIIGWAAIYASGAAGQECDRHCDPNDPICIPCEL